MFYLKTVLMQLAFWRRRTLY